jgi:hypothetical protein
MSEILDVLDKINGPGNEVIKENLKFLYEALTILDRKADALMAFDGLLIAAAAFAMEKGGVVPAHKWRRAGALLVILLALLAAGSCLWVARIKYEFLHNAHVVDGKLQIAGELQALATALSDRTNDYYLAWYLSVFAVALSTVIAASIFFIPAPKAKAKKKR